MSIWADADALLPGLLPAAFRGVVFYVPDARHEVGRRVIKTYFPGIDQAAFEVLGRHDGPIDLKGLYVGDDYVLRAEALRAALQAPGPGTLFHPWLGELRVIVSEPADIAFDVRELRVVRLHATFEPASTGPAAPASTLAAVRAAAGGLAEAARGFIVEATGRAA